MVSLVVVGLYALGRFALDIQGPGETFFVPDVVLVMACATAIYSLIAYLTLKDEHTHTASVIAYVAISLTIMALVVLTGGAHSPFVAIWLVVTLFCGLFGWQMLLLFGLLSNGYGIYMLTTGGETGSAAIGLMLLIETPLIATAIMWHRWHESAPSPQAMTALEKELSQAASKSDIIINSIADGVVVIDTEGVIQVINPAAQNIIGWSSTDAVGLDYRSVIKLTDSTGAAVADELSPIRQVMLSARAITNNDLTLVTKSGKKELISLVVSPLSANGSSAGVIAVFRDITNEKAEERQKAEFISTASHEMRTPVAAIEGYLGLALNPNTASIDDKARSYLQKAHEATQHLGRLFQDLLTVSKAEDARIIPRQTVVDVIALARETVEGLTPKAKEKGLEINYPTGESRSAGNDKRIAPAYYAYADPDQLREVLNNLIDNAIKYTPKGSVTVAIAGDADNLMINIADTGIGIPPEDLPHLFQKFYRVDNSDTREIGGTGLGLYISRRLTEANNGHITVQSAYGKGSTFTVQIPRISGERANQLSSSAAQPQPAATAPAPPTQA